jgi:hypothetical protein
MREPARRTVAVSVALVITAVASACSGGGSDGPPAPGCTHAASPATGPGDTLNHFPSEVGWSWTYRNTSGQLQTLSVNGTQVMGTETAAVFSTGELVVERPSGAYVLADPTVEPPLDQLYPTLIMPFPVAVTAATEQGRCTSIGLGDVDGDGKADAADLSSTLQVLSTADTATVEAGAFTGVAHLQQVVTITVRTTASGSATATVTQDDRFAPGVGLVSRSIGSSPPIFAPESLALVSYTPPAPAAKLAAAEALSAAPLVSAPRLEERALDVARALIGGARR